MSDGNGTPAWHAAPDRAVIALTGHDAVNLLQGLVTNNVTAIPDGGAVYTALLTPQGKLLHDFFVLPAPENEGPGLWLDISAAGKADLIRRLTMYKLRAKADITDLSDRCAVERIWAAGGPVTEDHGFADPRHPALGSRRIVPREQAAGTNGTESYRAYRLSLGIAETGGEIPPDKVFALEANLDHLHGVDFKKGCYIGQELTARMKHRTVIRKRLLPVQAEAPLPPGAPVLAGGTSLGEVLEGAGTKEGWTGIALIRTDKWLAADGAPTIAQHPDNPCEEQQVTLHVPSWLPQLEPVNIGGEEPQPS